MQIFLIKKRERFHICPLPQIINNMNTTKPLMYSIEYLVYHSTVFLNFNVDFTMFLVSILVFLYSLVISFFSRASLAS